MSDQLTGLIEMPTQPSTEKRPYGMQNCLVVIDLGNGEVKAKIKQGNSPDWISSNFPSVIAENFPNGFTVNNRKVVVGAEATRLRCDSTGNSDTGKIDNALPLLMQVIKDTVGFDRPLNLNVVFSCPSVKEYGQEIKNQIQGIHTVTIEGDELNLIPELKQRVQVSTVVAQLEGHHAGRVLKGNGKKVIIDIGNRTVIATCVNEKGGIVSPFRQVFNNCGVQSIANKISGTDAALKNLPDAPMLPKPQTVIDYLMDTKFSKDGKAEVANRISPFLGACLDEVAKWANQATGAKGSIHLIGGGAKLPGVSNLFGTGTKTAKDCSWSTVDGLVELADDLIGAANA